MSDSESPKLDQAGKPAMDEKDGYETVRSKRNRRNEKGKARAKSQSDGGEAAAEPRKTFGKAGRFFCKVCAAPRDHCTRDCPGNFCHKCGKRGHWVKECLVPTCDWCGVDGHPISECPEEDCPARYRAPRAAKRKPAVVAADAPGVAQPSTSAETCGTYAHAAAGAPPCKVRAHAHASAAAPLEAAISNKVDRFLENIREGPNAVITEDEYNDAKAS